MDTKDRKIAEQLRSLPWDDAPDAAHRDRLEADLRRAWGMRRDPIHAVLPRWQRAAQRGRVIMHSRIIRYSAVAAVIAVVVFGLNFLPRSSPPMVSQAWALEQSIAAMEDVRTVYLRGVSGIYGHDQAEVPFEFWARREAGTNRLFFRYECPREFVLFLGDEGYAYRPGDTEVRQFKGMSIGALKYWAAAVQMQVWIRGQGLANLKQQAQDWKEQPGRDEQTGRPCMFVTCTCEALGGSFWLQFDLQTKLPVRAKVWMARGEVDSRAAVPASIDSLPSFDAGTIVYNEPIAEERFRFRLPPGMTVVDDAAAAESQAMLLRAYDLFKARQYEQAIAAYQEVVDRHPGTYCAADALRGISSCRRDLQQHDEAIAVAERLVREYSTSTERAIANRFCLGDKLAAAGRNEEALRTFIHLAQLAEQAGHAADDPDREELRFQIARMQTRLFGDGPIPDWADVVDTSDIRERASLFRQADDLREAGRFQEALDLYRKVIPMYPPGWYSGRCAGPCMLGLCYEGLGQTEQAIEQFRKCIEQCKASDNVDSSVDKQAKEHLVRLTQAPASQPAAND